MKGRAKKASRPVSPSLLTGWARQGVQSFVAAQSLWIWRPEKTHC